MKPWQRVLHGVAMTVFVFLAGLVAFAVAVAVPLEFPAEHPGCAWGFLAAFQIAVCAIGIWKRTSYVIILPGLVLCGGMVAYLMHDDPQWPTLPDLGPVASTDSENYKIYCWMVKDSPYSRLNEVPLEPSSSKRFSDEKKEKWRDFIATNRETIVRNWESDRIGRDWIDALNQHPSSGVILGPSLNFSAVRAMANHRLAYVVWLATEGHGDEAMRLLIPFIRANYALQRSGTPLLNQMIPGVVSGRSYDVAAFLLDEGKLGDDSKKALAMALREAPSIEQVLRQGLLGETFEFHDVIERAAGTLGLPFHDGVYDSVPVQSGLVRFLQSTIYNPRQTERPCLEYYEELFTWAKARDFDKIEIITSEFEHTQMLRWALKNPVGRMLRCTILEYDKAIKRLWEIEDARLALLKRLGAP
jgi:hypothetical protein